MSPGELEHWRVPLEQDAASRWHEEYGIEAIYLNDIAAAALIEVPANPPQAPPGQATQRIAKGLRHLLQELWSLNLVRPVLAVYYLGSNENEGKALRRLTWDDEQHRGDFALRSARNREEAEKLLFTLMGDTMGALDDAARSDRVGVPEVRAVMQRRKEPIEGSDAVADRAEDRLLATLLGELERAGAARQEPKLAHAVETWLQAEGVGT